ncbi:hypothetical protein GCM10010219_56400 [Streptomyces netropsis]|nr:hypothetical protein GCM10010219_56400 [Streptomyces netropsis]
MHPEEGRNSAIGSGGDTGCVGSIGDNAGSPHRIPSNQPESRTPDYDKRVTRGYGNGERRPGSGSDTGSPGYAGGSGAGERAKAAEDRGSGLRQHGSRGPAYGSTGAGARPTAARGPGSSASSSE